MTGGSTRAEKNRLRQELLGTAVSLSPELRKEADRRIAEQVLSLPSWKKAKTVLAFVSLPREPDTRPLLEAARAADPDGRYSARILQALETCCTRLGDYKAAYEYAALRLR